MLTNPIELLALAALVIGLGVQWWQAHRRE